MPKPGHVWTRKKLEGMRFGKLLVVEYGAVPQESLRKDTYFRFRLSHGLLKTAIGAWKCVCECGKEKWCRATELLNGRHKSCGISSCRYGFIHGGTVKRRKCREYQIYEGAKRRCTKPNCIGYENYGGRGIQFKFNSYQEFIQHIGPAPSKGHTLDRINNDGHYEPGNVRWATRSQQARNKRIDVRHRVIRCPHCHKDILNASTLLRRSGRRVGDLKPKPR